MWKEVHPRAADQLLRMLLQLRHERASIEERVRETTALFVRATTTRRLRLVVGARIPALFEHEVGADAFPPRELFEGRRIDIASDDVVGFVELEFTGEIDEALLRLFVRELRFVAPRLVGETTLRSEVRAFQRELVLDELQHFDGNLAAVARTLDVARSKLYRILGTLRRRRERLKT